jgi:TolB-like protein/Flp pilus assembly protein TadD
MIGKTLSHYRIVEKIGAGGMGEVYRARDEHLGRDVALKVLPTGTLADEHARKRFRKEAQALSKLSHPHIATVFDFDTQDGTDFLVMELVEGVTLSDKLAGGPLPEKEITRLGMQLAEALEEAHERRVVHRDLKPGNVMVTAKGQVKVLDFGLAKLVQPVTGTATTESFTETQAAAGTLPYMAPEQLRGEPVDARTDIHALGAVLYEMATGRRPFEAKLATALAADIQTKAPRPPRELNRRVSGELERITLKCLEKEPENRYQSAKELAVDLRRLGTPGSAAAVLSARRPATRRRMVWAAGVALVALLAVLVGLNVGGLRDRLLGGPAVGQITSIAVLPLENLMGDSEQDYFVDGMHDELIANLAKIGALTVISRTSAMRYKGTDKSLPEIARELGVDAVIEGTVRRAGNQVRITVQLIEAATDKHLFAESYQRELRDVLALQSDVAQAVASEIKITLTPEEETRLASARHVSPEAYEDYLKGLYYWNRRTPQDKLKATQYFKEAIRKDPTYAPAYAGLADTYAWSFGRFALPPRELYPKARTVVLKALELDDRLAQAHTSLAFIKDTYDWDWPGAEKEYRRAIELNPSYPSARAWYALSLALKGRFEEAFAEIKRAEELDPLSLPIKTQKGWLYFWAGQFDRAMEQWRKVVELDPNFPLAHYNLGLGYTQKGMYEEAIAAYERAIALARSSGYLALLGHAYGKAGQRAQAEKILAELNERAQREYISGVIMALFYLGLDDKERALASLEKSYQDRDPNLPGLKLEPFWWDPLRSDPRFQSLLRRMNFPE